MVRDCLDWTRTVVLCERCPFLSFVCLFVCLIVVVFLCRFAFDMFCLFDGLLLFLLVFCLFVCCF